MTSQNLGLLYHATFMMTTRIHSKHHSVENVILFEALKINDNLLHVDCERCINS